MDKAAPSDMSALEGYDRMNRFLLYRTLMDFEYRFRGGAAFTKEPCIFGSVYVLKEPSWHKEPFAIPTGTNSLGTTFVPRSSESPCLGCLAGPRTCSNLLLQGARSA